MIVLEPTQFVVSIAAPNEDVDHPRGAIVRYRAWWQSWCSPLSYLATGYHEQVYREVKEQPVWTLQLFPYVGPCLREDIGLGKKMKNWREDDRDGDGGGVSYERGERRDRPGSKCVLVALRCEGLVQLCHTLWGLGRRCWMAGWGEESVGVVDEGITNVVDTNCDIWSKMSGGYSKQM